MDICSEFICRCFLIIGNIGINIEFLRVMISGIEVRVSKFNFFLFFIVFFKFYF